MAGKLGFLVRQCPYCKEGRLAEKPKSAFDNEPEEYSDPFSKEWSGERRRKIFSCKSCGSELNSQEIESLQRMLVEEEERLFSAGRSRKNTVAF